MTKSDAILVHLAEGNKVVRRGETGWRWTAKREYSPSLADPQVSKLFRADLVVETDGELLLTAMGKIVAEKIN